MMGRQSGQMSMIILDLSELIPENHLLRKINQMISFDFIYDLVAPYYPANGRLSVDPVSMFKMLLVGYLYGVKSERRLVQEVQLNIAYRWFCGFELTDKIPDHSMGSESRLPSVDFCLFDRPLNPRGASRNSGIGLCNKDVACVEEDRPIRCDTAAANFRRNRARGNIPTSCQGTYPCGMQSGGAGLNLHRRGLLRRGKIDGCTAHAHVC